MVGYYSSGALHEPVTPEQAMKDYNSFMRSQDLSHSQVSGNGLLFDSFVTVVLVS